MYRIKVLFLIHTLGAGGAERALVNLVNNMDSQHYDITVETMFSDGINRERLNDTIRYISKKAPCPRGVSKLLKLIPSRVLYDYFIGDEEYDVMIAYMHGAPVKVLAESKCKKISWLHNGNPETSTMFDTWFTEKNAINAYKRFDRIVGVCNTVSRAFEKYTGIDDVKVIYNTLDVSLIKEQAELPTKIKFKKNGIKIISTGRLAKEKGYLRLLDVCKRLKSEGFCFKLYLVGTGSELTKLNNAIKSYGLENYCFLLGFQKNPYSYVNACDVFVCSSFTEGLSTATIEALILGKAIVSTDVSGAKEIIGCNEYGLVVDNSEEGIYRGLKELLLDPQKIHYFKNKAQERASFFDTKKTVIAVEELINEVINE